VAVSDDPKEQDMDILNNLSDDQLALLGCMGALLISGTIMCLSYYVGPARSAAPAIRKLPHVERQKAQYESSDRKAA
jgi:hypothetical protein